ncbi:hypothetical protein PC110_g21008 [Phytophthora cactorum]|uniref:Uncharacterized protein n=1 Tax=Phytophthora cactorum TaxID=29920 RepID=A0A329REV4_9STRA|nr:hypothetical protein PC110_g21008 [Phytophthora cactorum]
MLLAVGRPLNAFHRCVSISGSILQYRLPPLVGDNVM